MTHNVSIIECDVLILSDSMLKLSNHDASIQMVKTVVRFIRGGAYTCVLWKKNSHRYNPKTILIHIRKRDIPNSVKKEDFAHLVEICYKSWESAEIHLLPTIYRKDYNSNVVEQAHAEIHLACENFP